MSDYDLDDSPTSQQNHGSDTVMHNISLDEPNAANNSIIGKVKSRVSSILPNSISKWFSPSSKQQNDSLNGRMDSSTSNVARRRRRIEVEEDDESCEEDDVQRGKYEENHNLLVKQNNTEGEDEEEDDESQNSEEEYNATLAAQKGRHAFHGSHPPAKRSRLDVDNRDSPYIAPRQPLIASTPSIGNTFTRSSIGANSTGTRSSYQRFTNLNLYSNLGKKEPAYDFNYQRDNNSSKTNPDIIDVISTSCNNASEKILSQSDLYTHTGLSSRRSLNIPSTSSSRTGVERVMTNINQLKRQPLSTSKPDLSQSLTSSGAPPRRTSTTINEDKILVEQSEQEEEYHESNMTKYNGQLVDGTSTLSGRSQGLRHFNGSGYNLPKVNEPVEAILDTTSESGESGTTPLEKSTLQKSQRKDGLFNTTLSVAGSGTATTRNSSRTSSFGNGLNFYSHLEGRKSLFAGPGHSNSQQLNNSTMSLTSLNRRQFNASIYGSTSALSDSRLLNTFSPFYKGKTTYGGAAAYNKYTTGAGASTMRITPTLIRPTSSLSSCSSSSNSLALNNYKQQFGDSSNISTTAKRILDLINDFATPLSDAKKMASNLKTLPIGAQSKSRLNENDLYTSRAMRLSQVKTPYSRPSVILQPSGNANNSGCGSSTGGPLPPIKELQVPTMSQLLQMKKIQTTTEKVRNITRDTVENYQTVDYSLPASDNKNAAPKPLIRAGLDVADHKQQKHTNKIKNKVSNTLRTSSASKDLQDEAPPPSVNLPTLAFPLMQSVPKFDIHFSSVSGTATSTTSTTGGFEQTGTKTPTNKSVLNTQSISPATTDKISTILENKSNNLYTTGSESTKTNFTFSKPLVVKGDGIPTQTLTPTNFHSYKFSPPLEVTNFATTPKSTQTQQPQLKTTGSCVDVFRQQPQALPPTTAPATSCTFGDKFKKSASEWDCETCMVRNNSDSAKCLACETPRKGKGDNEKKTNVAPLNSSFGEQFKKDHTEWECDVCMIRNKEGSAKCVACEAPHKVSASVAASPRTLPLIKNSFGAAFKPKPDTWECPTCMICNKTENSRCAACETRNPASTVVTSSAAGSKTNSNTFTYGFVLPQTTKNIAPDVGFQSLVAQQKASKWECDACMTRNDSERTKCACCEQPKPGSASNESSSNPGPAFSFGATAASKFSFGFSSNTKEEDLRHENTQNPKGSNTPIIGVPVPPSSATSNALPITGIQFGFKPTAPAIIQENKKDETDSKNSQIVGGFKFEATKNMATKPEASSPATSSFALGNKQTQSFAIANSTTTVKPTISTPSVKFSLTPASSTAPSSGADKSSGLTGTGLSFGSNTASSTTEGFVQDTDKNVSTTEAILEKKKPIEGFTFKTPAPVSPMTSCSTTPSGFAFGKTETTASPQNTTATSTPSAITVSTAANKPMFSFGSSASITQGTAAATSGTTFAGFSFGNNSQSATTTASDKQIGAVTSTSSTTTTTNSSTTPAPNTNTFVSFGSSTSYTPTFGSTTTSASASANPANNSTIVSSSTNNAVNKPTFGSFGFGKTATTNSFGSFGSNSSNSSQGQNKPVAFSFGSAAANTSAPPAATQTFAVTTAVSSTSWPKNNFLFGPATTPTPASTTQSTNTVNKEVANPPVFGAFDSGAKNASNLQTTSIFGNAAATSSNLVPFGSVGGSSTNAGTNLFASNSTPAASNIFGATHSGNALTPAPAFGSSPFGGGSALSSSVTPTFGSTALTGSTTLGSFRNAGANKITTNGPEAKKPEPAFNFGSSAPSAQSTSGGFNFGSASSTSAASKPAFNFGATSAAPPAFNFTGSAESQNSAKPFQFGAMPSAPVFNFVGGGAIETAPSAPFQFNAGAAAPLSSNIFAPSPTPSTQTAQQIKRKIRAPIRRVTTQR